MKRCVFFLPFCIAACRGGARSADPSPQAAAANAPRDIFVQVRASESFTPTTGAAALRAFSPDVAPVETDGECSLSRTTGSGATTAYASFPNRAASTTAISISFDSAGHLVRYTESRGRSPIKVPPGSTTAQRDSIFRALEAAVRATSITLDYPVDRAMAINRGGGRPTQAVVGTIRDVEGMEKLGVRERMARVRKLCGV